LLHDAVDLVGGSVGVVTRWDADAQLLEPVGTLPPDLAERRWRLGEGAIGRTARERQPILLNRGDGEAADQELERVGSP
jgi:hypothetical protein